MEKQQRIWTTLDPFIEGGPILGRKVANASFLKALLSADPYDGYHFYLSDDVSCSYLQQWAVEHFPRLVNSGALSVRPRHALQKGLKSTSYHCMHLSDALTHVPQLSQTRNSFALNIFPITGLTHSLSYARFMPHFAAHLWNGVSGKDAVIVTSRCARAVLERIFARLRMEYSLESPFSIQPSLVRIPLGVDTSSLPCPQERWDSGDERAEAAITLRDLLGIGPKTMFLSLSRFSHTSKMDLIPLFRALKRAEAAGLSSGDYVLVLAGWADEADTLPESLLGYARSLGIQAQVFLRPSQEERRALYAAADVFVSPSDNIQETFGLTVAEAMTASLPVIVSDFDGYRDIVPDNCCGFRIPTLGFSNSTETDVQSMLWFDNQYHLKLAQQTVVDIPRLSEALALLGKDVALQRRMGTEGRKRALEHYSWDTVITRYVSLWDSLAARSLSKDEEQRLRRSAHPLQMRYAEFFQEHFTQVLDDTTLDGMTVRCTPSGEAVYRGLMPLFHYAGMENLISPEAARYMLFFARKPVTGRTLVHKLQNYFCTNDMPVQHTSSDMEKKDELNCIADSPGFDCARSCAEQLLLWGLKQDYVERV